MSLISSIFSSATTVFFLALLLRAILLAWGIHQDTNSPIKYTDIDYYVFTDAARYISRGESPYSRATYRYTPLLAWLLYPTTWNGHWFHFGKVLFALSDLLAGWLIFVLLRQRKLSRERALKYASVWLLNPMVANISTRGSSEGLLCVLVMTLLWAFSAGHIATAGVLLGAAVHFKIYPFIYGISLIWALPSTRPWTSNTPLIHRTVDFFTNERLSLLLLSLMTFMGLNVLMYVLYGNVFVQHTFVHHLTRIDHRHNFSPYNTLLYLSSASPSAKNYSINDLVSAVQSSFVFVGILISLSTIKTLHPSTQTNLRYTSLSAFLIPFLRLQPFDTSRLAFLPQLSLSALLLPLLARHDLPATMLAQTLAFVTFNKVCTSQYFLWYLIFLPLYLPGSSLMSKPKLGLAVLGAWVAGQAVWLWQGYELEFLGRSAFVPGLWVASLGFFGVNCWILGIVVGDIMGGSSAVGGKGLGDVQEKESAREVQLDAVVGEPGPAVVTRSPDVTKGSRTRRRKDRPLSAGVSEGGSS